MTYVADWQTRLRGRIFWQFRGLPNITAISDAVAAEAQAFEDAATQALTITSLDDSTGAQLQVLGRIVGQGYTGEDEPTYRLRIRARVRANRSSGTADELYAVFCAALGLAGPGWGGIVVMNPNPAAFVFRSSVLVDSVAAGVLFQLLSSAKVAGSRIVFEWGVDAETTMFDDSAGLVDQGQTYPGDATDVSVGGDPGGSLST